MSSWSCHCGTRGVGDDTYSIHLREHSDFVLREHEQALRPATTVDVEVNVNSGNMSAYERQQAAVTKFCLIIGGLIFVAIMGWWLYLFAAVFAMAVVYGVIRLGEWHHGAITAERRRRDELVARADQQHAWTCQGDLRGTFGCAAPEMKRYWRLTA